MSNHIIHILKKEEGKNIHVQEIITMKNKPHTHDTHTHVCTHTNACTLIHLTHTSCTHTHTHTTTTTTPHHTHTYLDQWKAEQMMNIKVLWWTFGNGNEERQREKIHDWIRT